MMTIDAIIPALNEAATVGRVVEALTRSGQIHRVIVVDNASSDDTAARAIEAGATVVSCPMPGLGRAVKMGIRSSTAEVILKTDADIDNWNPRWAEALQPPDSSTLSRATFRSPYDSFPVTRLVVQPLLARLWPEAVRIPLPITGTYAFHRELFDLNDLSDNWAFDISVVCAAVERQVSFHNVDVGILSDRHRDIDHYIPMATDILDYFLTQYSERVIA